MTKKFFFMAIMTANLQGRPQVQFNTISMLEQRNVLSADLVKIQDAAARMMSNAGVVYDDLPIHNLFCLTPDGCTEEEFVAGTQMAEAEADAAAPELVVDNTKNEHVDEAGTEVVTEIPVADVTTADVKSED